MITIQPHVDRKGHMLLTTEIVVPKDRSEVFEFFADAGNLEAITPPWVNFHIVTERPINMKAGALIDYRLKLHHIPIRWRTEISAWEPPFRFVDRQLRGPYRTWEHLHTFEEVEGGTAVADEVTYCVPGGKLINRFFVEPDLRKIFTYRQQQLHKMLCGEPEQASASPT